jgi:hypothetical protein
MAGNHVPSKDRGHRILRNDRAVLDASGHTLKRLAGR